MFDSSRIAKPQTDFTKTDMVRVLLRRIEKVANTGLIKKRHIDAFTEAKIAV